MTYHIYKENESHLHIRGDGICPCYPRAHLLMNGDFLIVHKPVSPGSDESAKTINLAITYILNKKDNENV